MNESILNEKISRLPNAQTKSHDAVWWYDQEKIDFINWVNFTHSHSLSMESTITLINCEICCSWALEAIPLNFLLYIHMDKNEDYKESY